MREIDEGSSAPAGKVEKTMGEVIDARLSRRGALKTLFAAQSSGTARDPPIENKNVLTIASWSLNQFLTSI